MNFDKYIGLPYQENGRTEQGVDCWGLARLVYKQELDIELPDYSDLYSGSWDEQVTKLINHHKDTWQEVKQPEVGDLCLFNIYGEPAHIGVYVGESKFLHSRDSQDSVIESLNNPQWKRRLAGYFSYKAESSNVVVTGAPHPLKVASLTDWTVAGTTVSDLIKFIHKKYQISEKLSSRLIIMVDGVPISKDKWETTVLKEGQQVSYRTLAQGRGARMLLMLAVVIIAPQLAGMAEFAYMGTAAATYAGSVGVYYAAYAATLFAGMALINAIAPIRLPQTKDPGQPNQLNLFNGSSNQANRLGAIPVVLGKLRYVGLHGATPYIETNTNSNILNMMIIWGFGPLDVQDICVGATNLEKAYYDDLPGNTPRPVTLYGSLSEPQAEVDKFNQLYPSDVEQIFKNVELTNNPTDGNPWQEITFIQESTRVDIAFNFPEGMRRVKTKGDGAGDVTEANCSVEIQIAKYTDPFGSTPALNPGGGNQNTAAYTKTLGSSSFSYSEGYDTTYNITLYRWYDICIGPGGAITEFAGASTQAPTEEPNQQLVDSFRSGNYNSLLGIDNTYTRLPTIPAGYTRLYRICISSGSGLLPQYTVNYLQGQSGYVGLQLSYENETVPTLDDTNSTTPTGKVIVTITGGSYYPGTAPTSTSTGTQTIFETNPITMPGTTEASTYSGWCDLLKSNGIWVGNNTEIDVTGQVTITKAGNYDFEASVDDEATITIGGRPLFDLPKDSWKSVAVQSEYFEPGQYTLRIKAKNSQGGAAAAAVRITYTANSGANTPNSPQSIFSVGSQGFFYKRKDPFNYVYRVLDLPRARYKLRVRRVDAEYVETESSEYRYLNKVVVSNATCFDNKLPTASLPRGRLARTAIKVQSTSKANGQVDGINALLQTQAFDWDRATSTWKFRSTNNPASLFLYVLMHPANAYRLADMESETLYNDIKDKVDLDKIIEWHNFCNPQTPTDNNPILTYNSVITGTQSVMDTLRDICAAGKASPIFLDGKWSVVIDKPRNHVVQHFTPHNSWGFESNKLLPKIPHAFRVTIQDEENAYQAKELYAYNYGYNMYGTDGKKAAEIFEELQLPGVTNATQALHLARWHLAQLKLRPEVYTINTDFEYLVCNRGDLVRVSHDVPLWGLGSGRIKTVNTATKTIKLTEQVLLQANPTGANYKIRIRTNDITSSAGTGSQYLTLQRITTTGYYDTITIVESIPNDVEVDNLFMLGTENTETQELIVLSVEPSSNLTARITLVDYSPQIYTADLANDLIAYNPNTTLPSTGVVENTIVGIPNILSITSTRETSQEISTGTYQITALVTFANPIDLSKNADKVQFEMVRSDQNFSSTNPAAFYFANKETGNITFTGLESGQMYKVRARYSNNGGSIFGSWSTAEYFVAGVSGVQPGIPTLAMDLEDVYIVARVPQTYQKSADFDKFEYRIYKDTGVEDFWELTPNTTNNIKVIQTTAEARFNLLDMPTPRISQAGITYRVACRALNRNGEYSTESALGTLVVTTIT